MKRYFASNIKVGEYFTWHNSGSWGSHKVAYIGRGFLMCDRGCKYSFDGIIKGHYTVWETLPDRFGGNSSGIFNIGSEDIYKGHPEFEEYEALRNKLGLVKTRAKRIEIAKKRKEARRVSRIFENVRIFSGNDFKRNVEKPTKGNNIISLEKLDNQYFVTREVEKKKKEAYALGHLVEKYIDKHGINDDSLALSVQCLMNTHQGDMLKKLFA